MSKDYNLHDFLQDVAAAIKEKKGSNEPINAQSFAEEIRSIEGGGSVSMQGAKVDSTGRGIADITSIAFADGVTLIDSRAYYYCTGLKDLIIPEGMQNIGSYAFSYCSNIKTISLPSSIESLGQQAFSKISELESISIPKDAPITFLPRNLFWESTKLQKFIVPKNVNQMASFVFEGCSGLVYVDFSNLNAIPSLENSNAFSGVSAQIVVPDALYEDWITATNWSSLADRIVKDSEYTRPL
jgi:hypothetical protein